MKISPQAEILLVEDSPTDVILTQEAFKQNHVVNPLRVVIDGVEAMQYLQLKQEKGAEHLPGLILLDLNLPRKSGREVLSEIKADPVLMAIPVVIFTTSNAEEDISKSYGLHANCFVTKPWDFGRFSEVVRSIYEFWFGTVSLPR